MILSSLWVNNIPMYLYMTHLCYGDDTYAVVNTILMGVNVSIRFDGFFSFRHIPESGVGTIHNSSILMIIY